MAEHGPSEKAVDRAIIAAGGQYGYDHQRTRAALKAAHDPALGLDRSVCLRDVVKIVVASIWNYDGSWEGSDLEMHIRADIAVAFAPSPLESSSPDREGEA